MKPSFAHKVNRGIDMRLTDKNSFMVVGCATLLLAAAGAARADGITTSFSGYGTVGAAFTSDDNYQFYHDSTEYSGAGHDIDVGLETKLGLQAIVNFGSGFSVTAQEVARERGDQAFDLGTEWLYAQYSPDPDWKFRLGRVVLAAFLYSESRNVGYAAPWFNAPNEIYGAEPAQNLDGGQVVWHHNVGQFGLGLEAAYGSSTSTTLSAGTAYTTKIKSVNNYAATLDYGSFLFRVSQTTLHIPDSLPLGPSFVDHFTLNDKFTSAGVQYDDGKAIFLSEYAKRTENNFGPLPIAASESTEWYVAGGYRVGKWTPFVRYGVFKPDAGLIYTTAGSYGTPTVTLRYDLVTNVALKAEVSRAQAANGEYFATYNQSVNERVTVVSFGADFVF